MQLRSLRVRWDASLVIVTLCLSGHAAFAQGQPTAPLPSISSVDADTPLLKNSLASTHTRSSVFSDLFAPLGGDFRRIGSQHNWLVAGLGGLSAVAVESLDPRAARMTWSSGAQNIFKPGKTAGSFLAQSGGALATYAAGRIRHSPRVAEVGASLFRAQMVAQTTTQAIKFAANRTRPDGTGRSFPSGHSAAMFATATVFQSEFGWKAGAPAYVAASWVAASRVQANKHFISDVVAGATVGILAGRAVTFGRGNTRFAMSPVAVPGGIGISFNRVVKP